MGIVTHDTPRESCVSAKSYSPWRRTPFSSLTQSIKRYQPTSERDILILPDLGVPWIAGIINNPDLPPHEKDAVLSNTHKRVRDPQKRPVK